jgi:hypothetical protein
MRRKLGNPQLSGVLFYNVPYDLLGHFGTPWHPRSTDAAKNSTLRHARCPQPIIDRPLDPIGNGDGSDVTSLSNQINYRPVLLAPLKVIERQIRQFTSSQSTTQQNRQQGSVPLALKRAGVGNLPERACFVHGQPIS